MKKTLEFVTEADWVPDFWQFLLGLKPEDLIAELIQNDIDQGATRTVISFERDRIVCEGNGAPVDAEGWQRLRKIRGAGEKVPAKRGKIGVKNHGLKTAFTIGDELSVMSDGRSITQTLYARGRDKPPYPGASPEPRLDPDSPGEGCRVVISYRTRDLEPREGEAISLGAVEKAESDELFKSACASMPEQFAGIVSPEVVPQYEIVLRHWSLGDARFHFSCTRTRKVGKNIEIFRRRCEVNGSADSLPGGWREEAARRFLPLRGKLKDRVPDFYRRGNRFFVEVSWTINSRGKPMKGTGRFRYPIGYPQDSQKARTGHGTFFNAPIVSDTERHGPAPNDATNQGLREECERLLVEVIARHLVLRWEQNALNPLVPSPGSDNQDKTVRPLLAELAKRNAIPTLSWEKAVRLLRKGRKLRGQTDWRNALGRTRAREARRYQFIIPVPTWDETSVHSSLSLISPHQERQLDPRIDPEIIRLLADRHTNGFYKSFVTFDEYDARDRTTGKGNQYFAASETREREFANPLVARAYLDVIHEALEKCNSKWLANLQNFQGALLLPDANSKAVPFEELHASVRLPSDIPGLRLPPLLHPDVATHPIFRKKKWARPKYTMVEFLESGTLQEADEETRNEFWEWLRANDRRIERSARIKLAQIAIWPDTKGNLRKLTELCEPRSRRVAAALSGSIHRPHEQVRRLGIITLGKRGRMSIRRIPTNDELQDWLDGQTRKIPIGGMASANVAAELERFEADLAVLLKNQSTARILKGTVCELPAIARDRSVRPRTELVIPYRDDERLDLPKRFLLKNKSRATLLNKLAPTLSEPTVTMLVTAFEEDNANFSALQARIKRFLELTERGDAARNRVAAMAILPLDGQPYAPRDLAFKGSKGDYWGNWKIRIPATGLSQDEQQRYLEIGVTSKVPTTIEASRAFFEWISEQNASVLWTHISCVVRHILHRHGPGTWAETHTDIPFIPTEGRSGLRLVSLRFARRRPVYLRDFEEIADQVIDRDPSVLLVIDKVQDIPESIEETLRNLRVRLLREVIGEPNQVTGSGNIQAAPKRSLDTFESLRSSKFRRTIRKRLTDLGVESDLVRRDWYDRISGIGTIRSAEHIEARYRFRGRHYRVPVSAGFDPMSGTFWINEGQQNGPSSLYETIAAQLVFKPTARPMHWYMLERALKLEFRDPSFGRLDPWAVDGEEEQNIDNYGENEEDEEHGETVEAVFGHSPVEPDPSRNVPQPGPIPSGIRAGTKRRDGKENWSGKPSGEGDDDRTPELEKEHKKLLKTEHYASHCQMCLSERLPSELAPKGSYVEWAEQRRLVVPAHHVDPKSGGGARHAGNLMVLCTLHHNNYGRRLTRQAVTAAMRKTRREKTVRFDGTNGHELEVTGRVIRVVIPDSGDAVSIFFTEEHLGYWLSVGRPRAA